jgi:opacity protein-like surface antigen
MLTPPPLRTGVARIAVLFAALLLLPLAARAQDQIQRNEIFAGYAISTQDAGHANASLGGWEGSYTYKFSPYLGLTADFAGHYGSLFASRTNLHTYLFGPEVSLPMRFSPFVHALVGRSRLSLQGAVDWSWSFAAGGGVDYHLTSNLSLRIIQIDFISAGFTQINPNGRYSSGLVLHF